MIIESPAALKLVAALTEIGAAGATREYLIKKADISTSTFYRLVGPLIDNGLVKSADARYSLAFDNPYCFRFKLWHDMERLYRLPPEDRDMVLSVAAALQSRKDSGIRALWLVGSGARDELETISDLDFLLITERQQAPIDTGLQRRRVAVIQMSVAEFRDAVRSADGFVVSALQTGIVLLDDGFAQQFYIDPPPVRITSQQARAVGATADVHREQVLSQLESGDLEQARTALRNQAVHVGRLLLRAFGVLPNNRIELVEESRKYFGDRWAKTISDAAIDPPKANEALVRLSREITDQHDSFQSQADHLQRFSELATASERDLESLCARLFEEFVPDGQITRKDDRGVDLRIATHSGPEYLVEIKSSREVLPEAFIERAVRTLERADRKAKDARLVLITNSWVGRPPFEPVTELYRGFGTRVASEKTRSRLAILSGLQVLCAHNRYHLEDLAPHRVLSELLEEGRPSEPEGHAGFSRPKRGHAN